MALQVAFWILAVIGVASAVTVVVLKDVFRAALALVMCFLAVAGIYVTLSAEFLAVVQILIYVGAISILIIFAIMLSRQLMAPHQTQRNSQWWVSAIVAGVLFLVLGFILLQVDWPTTAGAAPADAITQLGQSFMGAYVLPFEVASIVLLVALVGSIIIARER
jgi:NADH:ubiquinone oxidoreductase subunit 6 (subunit J)